MKCISTNCSNKFDDRIVNSAEERFLIKIREDVIDFIRLNNGGYPTRDIISVDGEEYEVRAFFSLNEEDEYFNIKKPLMYFLDKTKGKIIPIGIDSGDNYYCVNNENGKVYYWRASEDMYYCIADSLSDFITLFE